MICTALLVGASVIAAACVACTPKTQPSAGPPVQHRAQLCKDEDSFVKSVRILQPGYDPTTFEDPPATDADLPSDVKADLASAFRIAPDFFRRDVCALDGVFIDQRSCDNDSPDPARACFEFSWGFRSHNESNKGRRYVAISLNLWSAGHSLRMADSRHGQRMTDFRHAPKLTDYSTRQLNSLLTQLNQLHWKVPPKFDSKFGLDDPADTPGMTVLAVLAHEVGHVRWYDLTKPKPGFNEDYDFARLTKCPLDGSFFQDSWSSIFPDNKAFAAPHWLTFGQPADPGLVKHAFDPQISDFVRPGQRVPDGHQPRAEKYQPRRERDQLDALAQSLNDVYDDGHPWPSLLGSLTPTEDLVETYALSVLTDKGASPPLRSLRLNIRGPDGRIVQEDVVAHLTDKSTLARKLACVSTLSRDYP